VVTGTVKEWSTCVWIKATPKLTFATAKQVRKSHAGHAVTMIPFEKICESISKFEKDFITEKQELVKKTNELVEEILRDQKERAEELRKTIRTCSRLKEWFMETQTRFYLVDEYIEVSEFENIEEKVKTLIDLDIKQIHKPVENQSPKPQTRIQSEALLSFLEDPGSFESLNLENIKLGEMQLISDALPDSQVTSLGFSNTKITDEKAEVLGNAFSSSLVTCLRLEKGAITTSGFEKLSNGFLESRINYLSLRDNNLQEKTIEILANTLAWAQFVCIDLAYNTLTPKAMKALTSTLCNSKVTNMNLEGTQISLKEISVLAECLPESKIRVLNLKTNKINKKALKVLANAISGSELTELDLGSNGLTSTEAAVLSDILPESNLAKLDLSMNKINSQGAKSLAKALPESEITSLNLTWNEIGLKGAESIAKALPKCKLTNLYLLENEIGNGKKALEKAVAKSRITFIDLIEVKKPPKLPRVGMKRPRGTQGDY